MQMFWPESNMNWKEKILLLNDNSVFFPFDDRVISFFQMLSRYMMKDIEYRKFPELISLAYWMRKSNLLSIQKSFHNRDEEQYLLARGTVLQFAPSNVDTIFVYTWILSLLAGNRSIIRISRNPSLQTSLLIRAIKDCLSSIEHYDVAKRIVIISYDPNEEITRFLSEHCHVRVIWGGDHTVRSIRSIPLSPLATEVVFPDRFSLSVIRASSVLNLNTEEFKLLIHNFYNDSFWFGQMACSSPRTVIWEGNYDEIVAAKLKFWNELDKYVMENYGEFSPASQVEKLTISMYMGTSKEVTAFESQPAISRIQALNLNNKFRDEHCGGGLFLELSIENLTFLPSILSDKDQTLSYFGYERDELIRLVKSLNNRGIDRIVPVGHALNFDDVWDGYRLLTYFTREIAIM